MHRETFPKCCKAKILCGFPQGDTGDIECEIGSHLGRSEQAKITKDRMKQWVAKQMDYYFHCGQAMLMATITEDQKKAQKVLSELGWEHTPWMKKKNNEAPIYQKGARIRLYYYRFEKFKGMRAEIQQIISKDAGPLTA